jgi:hypothetical protein
VRLASEVTTKDIRILDAETQFDDFLRRPERRGGLAHVVVMDHDRILGTLRIHTALRRELEVLSRLFSWARP